jgi:hypothetical protein
MWLIVISLLHDYSDTNAHSGLNNVPDHDTSTPSVFNGVDGALHHLHLPVMVHGGHADGSQVDEMTADEHFREDFVIMDAATEAELATSMAPGHGLRPVQAAEAMSDPAVVGSWSAVQEWPVVAIHATLLANGKVLAFDSVGDAPATAYAIHNTTRAVLWDSVTHEMIRVDVDTGNNLFCAGFAHLPNGFIYLAGGNLNRNSAGLDKTHIFNLDNNQWSVESTMTQGGRWYPSVTPLANGEMLITGGRRNIPEVRTTDGSLRPLSSASRGSGYYPWLQPAPNGDVFYAGPSTRMYSLSTDGTGHWQPHSTRDGTNRDSGSFAMYDIGKILVSGGGGSVRTAKIIDLNSGTPVISPTGDMTYGRRQHNLTILADGTVLATGGNSNGAGLVDLAHGVYAAELWNPNTGQWTPLAEMQVTRQYHSIALLLPDGRVLSAGGGICDRCQQVGYLAKNAEVFSPPYLFLRDGSGQLAPRPTITSAPDEIHYQELFVVDTPEGATIQKVALVRLASVTHSVNFEQRYIPLAFTPTATGLHATAPTNANLAPPGDYMLFILDNQGVPSMAKMVEVKGDTVNYNNDIIFADGFESNSLGAWSNHSTDGDDLSPATAASLMDTIGLQAQIDDNNLWC